MEKEITKKVWCCDVCERQSSYQGRCQLCNREYCYACEYIGYNPLHLSICARHQNDQDMKNILQGFESKFGELKSEILNKIRKVLICSELEKSK
jgi:hypothetical protein